MVHAAKIPYSRPVCASDLPYEKAIPDTTRNKYKCTMCDKTVRNIDSLRGHMSAKHNMARYFRCDLCSKEFSCRNVLSRHIRHKHKQAPSFREN